MVVILSDQTRLNDEKLQNWLVLLISHDLLEFNYIYVSGTQFGGGWGGGYSSCLSKGI